MGVGVGLMQQFPYQACYIKLHMHTYIIHIDGWAQDCSNSITPLLTHLGRGPVFLHDDVIKWKHFPRNWPFVRGIHRFPVNSPHKGQWRGALMFSLICSLNKRLSKQSWGWWFETLSRSLWRHCNDFSCSPHIISSWRLHSYIGAMHEILDDAPRHNNYL